MFLTKWGQVITIDGMIFNSRLNKICGVSQGLLGSHEQFLDGLMSLHRGDAMTLGRARTLHPLWIDIELLILSLLLSLTLRLVVIVITPHFCLIILLAIIHILDSVIHT